MALRQFITINDSSDIKDIVGEVRVEHDTLKDYVKEIKFEFFDSEHIDSIQSLTPIMQGKEIKGWSLNTR